MCIYAYVCVYQFLYMKVRLKLTIGIVKLKVLTKKLPRNNEHYPCNPKALTSTNEKECFVKIFEFNIIK